MIDLGIETLVGKRGIQDILYLPSAESVALALLPRIVDAIIEWYLLLWSIGSGMLLLFYHRKWTGTPTRFTRRDF